MCVAIRSISPPFKAVWNDNNRYLKKPEVTFVQKVWDIFCVMFLPLGFARVIGWAVHFAAKLLVLPSAWFYPYQILQRAKETFIDCCFKFRNQFAVEKHKIRTPDGVQLSALHFRHLKANKTTPTILFYQSNASVSTLGIYLWLIEEAIKRRCICNFVVFDYRGVGSSKGDAQTARELLIDGDAALQFVKDHLRVPPHLIHFYTWSLGAAIGLNTKAHYPECEGPLISERSFSSLKLVAKQMIPLLLKPFLFWLPWAAEKEGWNLKVSLNNLRGKTLIIYHPQDQVVPLKASAHNMAHKTQSNIELIKLYQTEEQIEKSKGRFVNHHYEILQNYSVNPTLTADQAAANFILPAPCA